jgi:serine phosphatase RsbU (regulator of sigma subunit)/CBS domain-containing protein
MEIDSHIRVRHIMRPDPVSVSASQSVQEVVQQMNAHRIGAVLVQEEGRLVGIFTERDLLRHIADAPADWQQQAIGGWMTPNPQTIAADESWESAMGLMERLHVRHLPVMDDGHVVGMLATRDLLASRTEHLNRLIDMRTRELRLAYERLEGREEQLRLHMMMAGRIQSRLLPAATPSWPEIACHAYYAPLDPLGGDHYDFIEPDEHHVGLLIADASGHSIPAAMVALMARTAFASAARDALHPAAVLTDMNRHLHGLTGEHFVTAFYALFDRQSRRLTYANAGHPYPLHYRASARHCRPLEAAGFLLGILPDSDYEEDYVQLEPGDRLLLYTDGLIDTVGPAEQSFGVRRLQEFLHKHGQLPADRLAQQLVEHVALFRGDHPPSDDLSILVAEVR